MARRRVLPGNERGVGLMEVIVATAVATLAVLGLAYTIGTGRALINRYRIGRAGLAEAQRRMEQLVVLPSTAPELAIPSDQPGAVDIQPFLLDGRTLGATTTRVAWLHDPASAIPGDHSLRRVTVRVTWTTGGDSDAVALQRDFPAR